MEQKLNALAQLAGALRELLSNERLRATNPGEQAVTAHLCALMQMRFPDWDVNAEWDRREKEVKMLAYGFKDEVAALRAIRPDIIVHQIGSPENLLVVEAKRVENRNDAQDKAKLAAMTHDAKGYRYLVGVRIVTDMPNGKVADCEVFTDGASCAELTAHFEGLLIAMDIR